MKEEENRKYLTRVQWRKKDPFSHLSWRQDGEVGKAEATNSTKAQ